MSKMPIARPIFSSCKSRSPRFAVHDGHNRPVLLRITLLYFLGEPVEDNILGVDFLVVDLASQDGPQPLVLRLGPPFLLFLAKDLVAQVVGRATKGGHRVDTADACHPLLAILLPLLQPFPFWSRHVIGRLSPRRIDLSHRHAFAIAGGDQDLLLCRRINRFLLVEVDLGMLGGPRDEVLQAVDRGSKAEDFQ